MNEWILFSLSLLIVVDLDLIRYIAFLKINYVYRYQNRLIFAFLVNAKKEQYETPRLRWHLRYVVRCQTHSIPLFPNINRFKPFNLSQVLEIQTQKTLWLDVAFLLYIDCEIQTCLYNL